ncbi:MAG: hypothetical protein ACR2P3_05035, partial [Geminicoccaceae bacterium]
MRLPAVFVMSVMLLLTGSLTAHADECEARVQPAGTVIKGSKIYTHWLVGHDPWRWATVSFRYDLTYVDEDNKEAKLAGRFRRLIRSAEEEYTELKNVRRRPARVLRTRIS